jgi:lactoylglutathione lyase
MMPIETVTRENVKQAVPFFGVSNMEASLRFYVDGLGFKMKRWWIPDGGQGDYKPDRRIRSLYREFKSRGIQTRDRPSVGNHSWVVPVTDPDGYRMEFSSPTDAPEDTELEE